LIEFEVEFRESIGEETRNPTERPRFSLIGLSILRLETQKLSIF